MLKWALLLSMGAVGTAVSLLGRRRLSSPSPEESHGPHNVLFCRQTGEPSVRLPSPTQRVGDAAANTATSPTPPRGHSFLIHAQPPPPKTCTSHPQYCRQQHSGTLPMVLGPVWVLKPSVVLQTHFMMHLRHFLTAIWKYHQQRGP